MDDIQEELEDLEITVGRLFAGYDIFFTIFKKWQKRENVVFNIGHSTYLPKTGDARNKRLKYSRATFFCKFGDKKHDSVAKNPEGKTSYKLGCQAFVRIGLSKDGEYVEIKEVNLNHCNHVDSTAFIHTVPENRSLPVPLEKEVCNMFKVGGQPMRIRAWLRAEHGINLLLPDLHRLHSSIREKKPDLLKAVKIIHENGGQEKILHDGKELKGLYFSTPEMRRNMMAFPHLVCLDGTYGLVNPEMTTMIFEVPDSNSCSEIVGIAFIVSEDRTTFQWLLHTFKEDHKDACDRIRCFMADKDLLERDLIKEIFQVPIYICMFHAARIFCRTITKEKMGITNAERQDCLKLLTKLMYAYSEDIYMMYYSELMKIGTEKFRMYFNNNWHEIRTEWTLFGMSNSNFDNKTNNALESINGKIKDIAGTNNTIQTCIEALFIYMEGHAAENDRKAARMYIKVPVQPYKDDILNRYQLFLTDSAFKKLAPQYSRHFKINIVEIDGKYYVQHRWQQLLVTTKSCTCLFTKSMLLPCRHIFALRRSLQEDVYCEELCDERWTRSYYKKHQRSFHRFAIEKSHESTKSNHICKAVVSNPAREREKEITCTTIQLSNTGYFSSGVNHYYRICILQQVLDFWNRAVSFDIKKISPSSSLEESFSEMNLSSNPDRDDDAAIRKRRKCIDRFLKQMKLILQKDDEQNYIVKLEQLKRILFWWRRHQEVYLKENRSSWNNPFEASQIGDSSISNLLYVEDDISIFEINFP